MIAAAAATLALLGGADDPGYVFARALALAGPRPAAGAAERRAHQQAAAALPRRGAGRHARSLPGPGKGRSRNVIGVVETPAACLWILMAHADTVPPAPGAEDNASGVGTLVALAPGVAALQPRCDVWLVATGAEERIYTGQPDHLGASALVRRVRARRPRDLRWALSLDEVGRGRTMTVRSPARRRLERRIEAAAAGTGLRVGWLADGGPGNSDHREFTLAGFTAAKLGVPDNPRRHTAADVARPAPAGDVPARAHARRGAAPSAALSAPTLGGVPEGDTIHYAANRIRPVLAGHVPDELATPHPRFGRSGWPERLAGRAVTSVDAHGKHLFLRFEGDLTIHSHLRMTGSWRVLRGDQRRPRMAWLAVRRGDREVVQLNGPVLELMTESRTRFDRRLAQLGPDILAPEFDARAVPAPAARGRPDAGDRRRHARPAHDRGDRQPVEVGGLLRGRDRSVALDGRGLRRGSARDRGGLPPADGPVGARRQPGPLPPRLQARRPPVPALRAGRHDPRARPGRRQPHDVLVPGVSGVTVRRVGHKGADHIAPGNTTASFDAALAAAVDMIEFDVLPEDPAAPERGGLRLAHDPEHLTPASLTLEAGLAHLASQRFADVELDVDLKLPGYEDRVLAALREHGLVERTIVSTMYMRSLIVLRELEPRLRLGWSVPRVKKDYTRSPLTAVPAYGLLLNARRRLPAVAAAHVRAGRIDALMAHWRLVTPRLVRTLGEAGGDLYVWTVDDAGQIRAARGARRHRRHHERPAPVRRVTRPPATRSRSCRR